MNGSVEKMPNTQRGRSLVELMIGLTLGLVVLGAVSVVYFGANQTGRQSASISRMTEDAGIAFNYIGGSLRMAGFSPPRALISSGSVSTFNGVKTVAPDKNFVGAAIRGCDNGFANGGSATFDDLTCSSSTTGAGAFAIRFEGDTTNSVPITASGVLYPSDCLANAVRTGAPSAYQAPPSGAAIPTGALTAGYYRLVESRFFGQIGAASGTPEIFCGGNGAGFNQSQPLIQSVENIQLRYGIAASTDPADQDVVAYRTASQIDALPGNVSTRWSRVISVRVCLVMRSEEKDQNGNGPYENCAGDIVTSNDSLIRRSFTSTFSLRNRAGFSASGV